MQMWLELSVQILRLSISMSGSLFLGRAMLRLLPSREGIVWNIAPYILFFAAFQLPSWIGDENPLFLLPFFFGVFLMSYQGPILARLVTGNIFYLLLVPVGMILDSLNRWDIWAIHGVPYTGIKASVCLLIWILMRRLTRTGKTIHLSIRLWSLCALLSFPPLIAALSFSIWNGFIRLYIDEAQLRIAYTILPFSILSACALLVALTVLSRQEELEREHQLAGMRELYYESLKRRETQVHMLRHDLRNHLFVVQGLLDGSDVERAKAYLAELTQSPTLHGTKRICENETANVVLSGKLEHMEQQGIKADVLVSLPAKLPISDVDLCALLGNALDNAIEGAEKASDKNILVRARADRGMLMLCVENAFAVVPLQKDGRFVTMKPDKTDHGFGIAGMCEIAERYGGSLETKVQDGQFELVVCLPI